MKIYLDLIFLLNFSFDLMLLISTSLILKRNVKFRYLFLGALFGSLSIFLLFIKLSSISLFFIKILISIIMCLISFKFKNIKYTMNNMYYLYMVSIVLGGFIYLLNIEFSYKQVGLIFYHGGLSINFILILILSPIIIFCYVRQSLKLKNNYSNYYKVDIYFKDGTIKKYNAFLDTGNKLIDPYKKRPIIIISDYKNIKDNLNNILYVPYDSVNNHGLLKCIVPEKIYIYGIGIKNNLLVGISNEKICIDGINCILNSKLLEE